MATKNIVPRTGSQGQLGTDAKPWKHHIADSGSFELISGSLTPDAANTYDLGTASKFWRDLYISSGSIKFVNPSDNKVITTLGLDADGNQNISGSFLPDSDSTYDLGSSTKEWRNLYIDGTANIDSLTLTSGATVTAVLDEDAMGSNSATALATQQSIKAYVDTQITAEDLDVSSDSGTIAIDLDSETFTIAGGTGITTSATSNTLTITSAITAGDGLTLNTADIDIDAAQTTITSIYNSSLAIGYGASHANINFGTDNEINFDIDGTAQVVLKDGVLEPVTDEDIDLGSSTKEFKDLYIDGTAYLDSATITAGTITGITDLVVADGGTGASTFTDGGVLLGSGTDPITATAVLANGQLLIGDNSGDPTVATLTGTANEVGITNGAGSITIGLTDDVTIPASLTVTTDLTVSGGDITLTGAATDIDLIDNNSSALSFDASGKSGILEIITTNNSERVKISGGDLTEHTGSWALEITGSVSSSGDYYFSSGSGIHNYPDRLLTGSVTSSNGSNQITGSNTLFTSQLKVGDSFRMVPTSGTTQIFSVASILNNTSMSIDGNWEGSGTSVGEGYSDSNLFTIKNGDGHIKYLQTKSGDITITPTLTVSGSHGVGGDITADGTIQFGTLSDGTIGVTAWVDEDNMSSDSATLIPTQQSVKAYVDSQVTAQDLDATTDSGTIDIDLDSETLTIAGGEGIDTSATGTTITIAGEEASTSNKGVASFSSDNFSVSSGVVTIKDSGVILGTETTGNYVATAVAGTGISVSGATGDVTISSAITAGDGLTLNTADIDIDAAQTTITSIYNSSLAIGYGSSHANIDFGTDNAIIFDIDGTQQLKLTDGVLAPITDNDIDLGTSTLEFKDAFFDGTVTSDAFAGPLTGDVTGNADTATALASGRTIGMTGDVVWTSPSFDGSGNVTAAATIQATSVENSMLAGSIANSKLANSTISGIALGSNLADLTVDNTTIQLSSGTTYNGGTALTISGKTAAIANGGSGLATADQIHTFVTTQTDTIAASTSGTAAKVTVTDDASNNNWPIVLHDGSNALLDDTGTLYYNPSTATMTVTNLNVEGSQSFVDQATLVVTSSIQFEGATADGYETTLTVTDPTADRTWTLQNATDTVVGRATTDTLTNKSIDLDSNTLSGTVAEFNSALQSDSFATLANTVTLTNKTLTTPTIGSFANANHDHSNSAGGGQITLGTGTTGNYVATAVAGDGIDVSGATGDVTISAEDSTAANKGVVIVAGGTNASVGYSSGTATVNVDDAFLKNDASDTTSGTITAAGFTTTGTWTFDEYTSGTIGITTIQDSGTPFNDNDTSLMTAAAVDDRILDYGYTTDANVTHRTITAGGNTLAGSETLAFTAGSNVTITETGGAVTIASTDTNTNTNQLTTFTLTGDAGSNQTIEQGSTLDIAGGTGITTAVGATDTVTITNSGVTQLSVNSGLDVDANTGSVTLTVDLMEVATTGSILQTDYVFVGVAADNSTQKMTFTNFEDEIFGNVSGDIEIAAGGAATIQANSVALSTDTTGDYVATITGGTGITSTAATSGEGTTHSLSVDASQTQITSVGTIGTGVWNGTKVASAYLDDDTAHLSGTQTFSGEKTFTGNIVMGDDTSIGISDSAERIEFDGAGDISVLGANFGIGTSSPGAILDIDSGATGESDAEACGIRVTLQRAGSGAGLTIRHEDASGGNTDVDEGSAIHFQGYDGSNSYHNMGAIYVRSAESSVSDSDSPGYMTFHTTPNGSDSISERMRIDSAGDVKIEESLGIGVAASSTTGRLDCSNDVIAFSSSDRRWKENIIRIENPLDKISKIGGYTFDWKELTEEEKQTQHGNSGHDVGVIAQEIQEVLPEVVKERDNGYLAVDYEKLVPLLIESIKELKSEVDHLKKTKMNKRIKE